MSSYQQHTFEHCILDRVDNIRRMVRRKTIRPKSRHEFSMDSSKLHWRRKENCCFFEWGHRRRNNFNHIVPLVSIPSADDLREYGDRAEVEMRALRGVQAVNIFLEQLRISQVVQTKLDRSDLILFEVPVMSSMHSKTWHVCTAFDQSTGKWMHAPYSFYSCPQGSYLCSHQMQVLAALRILQLFLGDVRNELRKDDDAVSHQPNTLAAADARVVKLRTHYNSAQCHTIPLKASQRTKRNYQQAAKRQLSFKTKGEPGSRPTCLLALLRHNVQDSTITTGRASFSSNTQAGSPTSFLLKKQSRPICILKAASNAGPFWSKLLGRNCVPWLSDDEGAAQYVDPETPPTKRQCRGAPRQRPIMPIPNKLFDQMPPAKKMRREDRRDSTSERPTTTRPLSQFATAEWCSVNDRCQRHYGWKRHQDMVNWLTKVHFPGLSMERVGTQVLSDFEQCIFVISIFRSRDDMVTKCDTWGIKPQTASGYMKKWSVKLERTAKIWCRLRFDREYLLVCQTAGMGEDYSLPISHLVDGTVCQTQFSRSSNSLKRMFYNSKIHSSGTLTLAHTTPSGLVLFATAMFCGGAQEPDLVRIHQSWWDEYPSGFGRLADKGFATFTSFYYKNGSEAIHPKFLSQQTAKYSKTGTKQLQPDSIVDGAKQSKDRYVVETVFSRVKRTLRLGTIVTWGCLGFLNACYLWGCASAGLYDALQPPIDWNDFDKQFRAAEELK